MTKKESLSSEGGRRRRWPVRIIMMGMVFALVLPGLVFCGILLNGIATGERARSREAAQASALRIAETLDRELSNLTAALVALSTSPALLASDLTTFEQQARALAAAIGQEVVLADLDGQERVNTRIRRGDPLPRLRSIENARRAIETRGPAVSNLFTANGGAQAVALYVPVFREGSATGVLVVRLDPERLSKLVAAQNLPEGWLAAVSDGGDRVIARSRSLDLYLGQTTTADFREHGVGDQAVWVGTTLEGTQVLVAMHRVRLADWKVGVGVALTTVEAPLRRTVVLLAITGAVTLALAGFLAWQLANSIARPLRSLALAGEAMAGGLPVQGVRSAIDEVDAVSRALARATDDLRKRAAALAAERAQLAAVIETVPVGLLIAEAPSGRIVARNSFVERMLLLPARAGLADGQELAGDAVAHHPDGRRVQAEDFPLHQALAGVADASLQCSFQRGDGSSLWVELVAAPIRGADGAVSGAVVAVLDIDATVRAREAEAQFAESLEGQVRERTAALEAANQRLRDEMAGRAAAEEQLRQAQKMEAVGQLTGGIAHDFNNLLTIVMGSLDLLRRRVEDDRARRLVDNALEGTTRAATLTARLLAFSRRQPLMPQTVDVNQLVLGDVGPAASDAGGDGAGRDGSGGWVVGGAGGSEPVGECIAEPCGECAGCDAVYGWSAVGRCRGRAAGDRDLQCGAVGGGGAGGCGAGRVCVRDGERHGDGNAAGCGGAGVRTVLHDEAAGPGDGLGAEPGAWVRQAERRACRAADPARRGHDGADLSAAEAGGGRGGVADGRGGSGRRRGGFDGFSGRG